MIQIQEALTLGFSNWSYAIRAFLRAIMIVGRLSLNMTIWRIKDKILQSVTQVYLKRRKSRVLEAIGYLTEDS